MQPNSHANQDAPCTTLPEQEHVVPREVVDVLCPLQQDQLRQDGNRLQVDGEGPQDLQEATAALSVARISLQAIRH